MSVENIYENNSIVVRHVLTNPLQNPIYVDDATVGLTILDKNEVPLPDEAWPINMPYQGADGVYMATIVTLPSIKAGKKYFIVVDAVSINGVIGQFKSEAIGAIKDL